MRGAAALAVLVLLAGCQHTPPPLRVCADPNNLPFSNRQQQGFENRLAQIVARDLHRPLQYVWWAQRRGNVRETLAAGRCDLIPGVVSTLDRVATSVPYYRSSYVAVTRAGTGAAIDSFDDPRLKHLRIGVELVGDDGSNTPPAHALSKRGIVANVRGYMVTGNFASSAPRSTMLDALARGEVDVAFAWGPVAGFYAKKHPGAVQITPLKSGFDGPQLPMAFDISVGTRKDDLPLLEEIDAVLSRRSGEITALLRDYGVPGA